MRYYDVPVISGSSEEQLEQIKDYLHRQVQDMNHNLQFSSAEGVWKQTVEALNEGSEGADSGSGFTYDEEMMRRGEYVSLKGLIIRAATEVIKYEDRVIKEYQSGYLAKSKFGVYFEKAKRIVDESACGTSDNYEFATYIENEKNYYRTDMEAYINRGILDSSSSSPIFGIEVGYSENTFTYNGKTFTNNNPSKIRITPDKISFYNGVQEGNLYEVAYIEQKAIYFPQAHITGGTIKIGKNFYVSAAGNITATSATLSGTIIANAGYIGGFEITGDSDEGRSFWPCSIASVYTPSDGVAATDYQYAVFFRGNNKENGTEYGAVTKENAVFGIKRRAETVTTWKNDDAPYVFSVNMQGQVRSSYVESASSVYAETDISAKRNVTAGESISCPYISATSNRVALGYAGYKKNIEVLTSGEIQLGQYRSKVKNIYLLAESDIRIGEHTVNSFKDGEDNYPSTQNVYIQANTLVQVGMVNYYPDKVQVYAGKIELMGNMYPVAGNTYDCGSSGFKWRYFYSQYLTAEQDWIVIGTRGRDRYTKDIYIRTDGKLILGQDSYPASEAYLVATEVIRIGQYNTNCITKIIKLLGSQIQIGNSGCEVNITGTVKVNGKVIS